MFQVKQYHNHLAAVNKPKTQNTTPSQILEGKGRKDGPKGYDVF